MVAPYVDGVGNKVSAVQWDGTPETLTNIQAWTKKVHVNRRGVLGVQTQANVLNVAVGDWLVMDSHRLDQVFPSTNGQFTATYVAATP